MIEPLVPPEVNLRGLPWMRLDTTRLLDSDLFALSTGDEFKAAVALWCKSWAQLPGGSLPTDDRVLAHLSGAGSKWKKVKAMALRGWVLASDGRLYHPIVAEQAIAAWEERQEYRAEIDSANERKQRERAERSAMFERLKTAGFNLAWNTPTGKLRELIADLPTEPVTQSAVTGGVTGHSDSHGLDGTGRDGILITQERSTHAQRSPKARESDPRSALPEPSNAPTEAGRACLLMRQAGCATTNSAHPDLLAALREGVTPEALAATVTEALDAGKGKPFAWAITTARSRHAAGAAPITRTTPQPITPSNGPTSKTGQAVLELERMKSHANRHDVDARRGTDRPAAVALLEPGTDTGE